MFLFYLLKSGGPCVAKGQHWQFRWRFESHHFEWTRNRSGSRQSLDDFTISCRWVWLDSIYLEYYTVTWRDCQNSLHLVSIPLASSLLFILKKEFSLRHPTEDKVVANGRGYIVEPEKKLIDTRWRVPWRPKNIIYISLSYFLSFFLWIGKNSRIERKYFPNKKEMRYLIAFFFLSVWGIEKMLFSGTGTGGSCFTFISLSIEWTTALSANSSYISFLNKREK
jgi:hypothetical protein